MNMMVKALKSTSWGIAVSLTVSCAWAQDQTPVFAQDDPAKIWIEDSALYFFGSISTASRDAFLSFVSFKDTSDLNKFVINSLGGDTSSGRAIGRWIYEKRLTVEVDAVCFSSCANYIFPAGASKVIRTDSFVGWHGSEKQYDVIAESLPDKSGEDLERAALRMALIPALPESASGEVIEKAIDQQVAIADASRRDEANYFKTIGMSSEFILHGMRPGNIDAWRKTGRAGWTYTLKDMERLGLGTVTYLGDGDYATNKQVTRNVFVTTYQPDLVPID